MKKQFNYLVIIVLVIAVLSACGNRNSKSDASKKAVNEQPLSATTSAGAGDMAKDGVSSSSSKAERRIDIIPYEFDGCIGPWRDGNNISMTIWISEEGDDGDSIDGFLIENGEKYPLSGTLYNRTLSLEEKESVWPQLEFQLNQPLDQTVALSGTYIINYGHSADPDDTDQPQGPVSSSINMTLSNFDRQIMFETDKFLVRVGEKYNNLYYSAWRKPRTKYAPTSLSLANGVYDPTLERFIFENEGGYLYYVGRISEGNSYEYFVEVLQNGETLMKESVGEHDYGYLKYAATNNMWSTAKTATKAESVSTSQPTVQENNYTQNRVQPTEATTIPTISAGALGSAFSDNEVAARRKYVDKTYRITGIIESFSTDYSGAPIVYLRTSELLTSIKCFFSLSDEELIATLHKGANITVQGRIDDYGINVKVKNCKIIQ